MTVSENHLDSIQRFQHLVQKLKRSLTLMKRVWFIKLLLILKKQLKEFFNKTTVKWHQDPDKWEGLLSFKKAKLMKIFLLWNCLQKHLWNRQWIQIIIPHQKLWIVQNKCLKALFQTLKILMKRKNRKINKVWILKPKQ